MGSGAKGDFRLSLFRFCMFPDAVLLPACYSCCGCVLCFAVKRKREEKRMMMKRDRRISDGIRFEGTEVGERMLPLLHPKNG